jgi:hypothetical protein
MRCLYRPARRIERINHPRVPCNAELAISSCPQSEPLSCAIEAAPTFCLIR